jgi:hypothetical protein
MIRFVGHTIFRPVNTSPNQTARLVPATRVVHQESEPGNRGAQLYGQCGVTLLTELVSSERVDANFFVRQLGSLLQPA